MNMRRITATCLLITALAVVFVPSPTQATDGTAVATIFSGAVLDMVADALGLVNSILVWAIGLLAGWLQGALELDPSGGGSIIYTAWRTLRDLCNMAFIIALILMAFGTIFDSLEISFLKPYSISGNGRSAITGFLMAAIFLNFSLAIGQTVMAASNKVSAIVLTLLPKNLGPQIAQRVGFAQVANGIQPQAPLVLDVPPELLPPDQYAVLQTWNPERLRLLDSCLKGEFANGAPTGQLKPGVRLDTPAGCFEAVQGGGPGPYESGVLPGGVRSPGLDALVTNEALLNAVIPGAGTALKWYNKYENLSTQDLTGKQSRITGYIFSIVVLGSLLLSFISMLAFAVIRIPMLWILLALSPVAWTSLAFPGATFYKEWWKQFWAWNLFSPLYLFVIYLGMLLLQNTNVAIASLGAQGSPFLASAGVAFQYLIAAIVFTGGAGLVLKASFLTGTVAGGLVERFTKFTGIGGPSGAFGPVGRFLGYTTGATAAYKGVVGGVTSKYEEKVTKPGARRQEDITAGWQKTFGDRSAIDKLQQTRIKEQMKKNEEAGLSVIDMKDKFGKAAVGTPEYFALGQALLKEGELTGEQMRDLGENAKALGGIGQNAIRQQVTRKIAEQTKDKKFRDDKPPADATAEQKAAAKTAAQKAKAAFDALPDEKERVKFLQDLKKNQLAVYAQLVSDADVKTLMATKGIDMGSKGEVMQGSDIIESNTSKLEAEDISTVMKIADKNGWALGPNFEYRRKALLNDKNNVSKMMDGADVAGKRELTKILEDLKDEALDLERQKAKITAEATIEAQRQAQGSGNVPPAGNTPPSGGGGTPPPTRPSPRPTPTTPPAPTSTVAPAPSRTIRQTPGAQPNRPVKSGSGTERAAAKQVEVAILINGKPMGTVVVPKGATDGDIQRAALGIPTVARQLNGKAFRTFYALGILNITTT